MLIWMRNHIYELGNCPFIEVPEGMTRIFPYEDEE